MSELKINLNPPHSDPEIQKQFQETIDEFFDKELASIGYDMSNRSKYPRLNNRLLD